jgi:hypothetical protein
MSLGQPTGGAGWTCSICWSWVSSGSSHYCGGSAAGVPKPDPLAANTAALTRLAVAIEKLENPKLHSSGPESIKTLEARLVAVEKAQQDAARLFRVWLTGDWGVAICKSTEEWLVRWG